MYRFTGFFARPVFRPLSTLPDGAVWREVVAPFVGVGVRMPPLVDDEVSPAEARRVLADYGLTSATDWLYLSYVTWAGRIDGVYGLGAVNGREFGPVGEWDGDKTRAAYLKLMGAFGVAEADALNFPPFVRGFWGE